MFFNTKIKVIRSSPGYYDNDGLWVEGGDINFNVMTSIQPTSKNDMDLLSTGREYRQTHTLYSARRINVANLNNGQNADIVMIDGKEYECVHTERWQNGLINHFKSIVELRHAD